MAVMDVLKLAAKSRVSVPTLTRLLNADRYRYVWVVGDGHVEFSNLMTEAEWEHLVVKEFATGGNVLVLQRRLGPYVQTEKKGCWILQNDRMYLERGSLLEKAVVQACNNALENGDEDVLEGSINDVAIHMMDHDADVEKLTAHEGSKFSQSDVVAAIKAWRKNHTWEDFTKMPA